MNFRQIFSDSTQSHLLLSGRFGLEKEHVRVDEQGKLAKTAHPAVFGDKLRNPYVTVDFSESQLEMITPPVSSVREALGFMETIHDVVSENLYAEYLWPQSMPPELPSDGSQIPLAQFDDEHSALAEYRRFLAHTYGRRKQMISGVHVNISLPENLLRTMRKELGLEQTSMADFTASVYMKALRNMLRYRWMPLALLGNSPAAHKSYSDICTDMPSLGCDTCGSSQSVSIRASLCGYRNNEEFILDYTDWASFHRSVRELVDSGKLIHEKELYSPIRVKTNLSTGEITHLEFRMLDLDPTTKVGIRQSSLHLLHLYLLWAIQVEEPESFDAQQQEAANKNQYNCACCGLHSELTDINGGSFETSPKEEVARFLESLKQLIPADAPDAESYMQSILTLQSELEGSQTSPLEETRSAIIKQGFINYNLTQAKAYKSLSQQGGFRFTGLEDLELSTQLMLREAVLRGISFELLDRSANFVKFQKSGHIEYVQQATKTSRDNYSSILMMKNKLVTKKVLNDAGVRVPLGGDYTSIHHAQADFSIYQGRAIVIKPKSTNFGLGISILKENSDAEHYLRALDMAFAEDSSVLIEPFIEGREFRFFIIDDSVAGILHRVPANVLGDGKSTIEELVLQKNQDPLRGKGYVTPLEKIALGDAEALFLETQGLHFKSIPQKDQTIYLRENSNISTGGDSIDFTDEIHASYKDIAVRATKAMGARITGLDMIIDDISAPASDTNYAIIEMNFNPAIHIHCFPYRGNNRHLNSKLMDFLGF